jgi:hypothetical protein
MGSIALLFASAFRDFKTDGVSSSGLHEPIKSDIRAIGSVIDAALSTLNLGGVASVVKDTRANLNADLAHAANVVALVYADATDANNDFYIKTGAAGAGGWTLTSILHDAVASVTATAAEAAATAAVNEIQNSITSPYWEKNVYNQALATDGLRLDIATGNTTVQAADYVSGYIGPLIASTTLNFKSSAGNKRHAVYSSATIGGAKTFVSGGNNIRSFVTGANAALIYWVRIGGSVGNRATEELYEGVLPLAGVNTFVPRTKYTNLQLTTKQARERLFDSSLLLDRALKIDERNNAGLTRTSVNLIDVGDPARVLAGHALGAAGDIAVDATFTIIAVPVSPLTQYSFGKKAGVPVSVTSPQTHQYDANGAYIAATDITANNLTTNAAAATMLVEIFTADISNFMMVAGPTTSLPRLYQPYKQYVPAPTTGARVGRFEGVRGTFLTDSIGVPATSWPFIVAQQLRLKNYPNDDAGVDAALHGGSWPNSSLRPNVGGSSPEKRVNYGLEAGNDHSVSHFYNRVQYLDPTRAVHFIQGGTNAWGTPIGGGMVAADAAYIGDLKAAIETYRVAVNAAADPQLTLDGRSTVGAMILTFHKMMTLFPQNPIFFIGAFPRVSMYERSSKIGLTHTDTMAARGLNPDGSARGGGIDVNAGLTLPEYVEVQERVCGFFGVPFYNPFRRGILRPQIPANYAVNFKDNTHPTDVVGQEKIGLDISRWVEGFAL